MFAFMRKSICTYAVLYPTGTFDATSFHKYCVCDQTKVWDRFEPVSDTSNMVCCLDHDLNLHKDPRRKGYELKRRAGQGKRLNPAQVNLRDFGI
jgi:hypothetical protein